MAQTESIGLARQAQIAAEYFDGLCNKKINNTPELANLAMDGIDGLDWLMNEMVNVGAIAKSLFAKMYVAQQLLRQEEAHADSGFSPAGDVLDDKKL